MVKRISMKDAKKIQKHRYILKKLSTSNLKTRKAILQNAPSTLFTVLSTIFKLVANNQLDLTAENRDKIKKHKRIIHSNSRLDKRAIKGKLVRQKGGSLQQILSTVLPIIGLVVKSLL